MRIITFDTADAAWLTAYTHFISAFAELVLAFEPTEEIGRVMALHEQMDSFAADSPYQTALTTMFGDQADRLAMIYFALRRQPDVVHTKASHGHLVSMIAQNRLFWTRVYAETDNRNEWVPNDNQDQGLGLRVPTGTGRCRQPPQGWQGLIGGLGDTRGSRRARRCRDLRDTGTCPDSP